MKAHSFALELKQKILLDPYYQQRHGVQRKLSVVMLAIRLFVAKIIRVFQKLLFLDQWYLLFDFSEGRSVSFQNFKEVVPPRDRFWADPHVIEFGGKYFVFVEEYLYKKQRAYISVIEFDEQGHWKKPVMVLERDYHLSYPFVFEFDGRYYMVPESSANKTIELYECTEFPYKWNFKMTLMENVNAVDTTIFRYQDKWWLFTGMQEDEELLPFVKLNLFSSTELFTRNWVPHPRNPIEANMTKARSAGNLYLKDGKIIRPSQNCSKSYGYGFYLNEVLQLSEYDYKEKTVMSVIPDWNRKILGTHTYVSEGKLTVIDAFARRKKIF